MNQVPVVHDYYDDNIIGEDNNVGIMKRQTVLYRLTHTQTYIQSQACITHMHERKVCLSNISSPYYIMYSCRRHTTVNVSPPSIFLKIK